jgi:type II secretory pathway pseudopilin PulG
VPSAFLGEKLAVYRGQRFKQNPWCGFYAPESVNIKQQKQNGCQRSRERAGMTLVEVMVGLGILTMMTLSLYAGFAYAFAEIRLTQENARATQILAEKMEVVRVLNWDQVANLKGYIPSTFTAPFYANNPTNPPPNSFNYTGQVLVTNAPVTESYAGDLRMIQIDVSWPSGGVTRHRKMVTFVSQYGIQKYEH